MFQSLSFPPAAIPHSVEKFLLFFLFFRNGSFSSRERRSFSIRLGSFETLIQFNPIQSNPIRFDQTNVWAHVYYLVGVGYATT